MMTNPDRIAFTLFGAPIYWYGILIATGMLVAVLSAMKEAKRQKLHDDTVLDLCLVLIPSGIVGARLYYVLFQLDKYLADPISMLYIWEGGLAIYGAIIGGAIGLFIYCHFKKIRPLKLGDVVMPGVVLAQGIGRWGNFFNQEAFGLPVTNPDHLWFPLSVRIDGTHYFDYGDGLGPVLCTNPYHYATFFYESLWCVLVFAFLWFFLRKRKKHDGDLVLGYMALYGLGRFFIEGLRGDSLWLIDGAIRVSQGLSLVLVVAAVGFALVRHFREKKLGQTIWPAPEPVLAEGEPIEESTEETPEAEEGFAEPAEGTEDTEGIEDTEDAIEDAPENDKDE